MKLDDFLSNHPVDRENVEAHKERMLAEVRAFPSENSKQKPG